VIGQYLICVANSNMFTSLDSSNKGPEGPAGKRGSPAPCAADRDRGCRTAARGRVCVVAAAGLPLPPASRCTERPCSRRRTDGGDHVQTPGEHRAGATRVRPAKWPDSRANRDPGARRVFRHLSAATWLTGPRVTAADFTFTSITHSIDYGPASWRTRTRFWPRPEPARSRLC
jgi:hypothetical protein